jgi:hypothetical protein
MLDYADEQGAGFVRCYSEDKEYLPEAFVTTPESHPSWNPESMRPWLALEREYWRDCATGPEVRLEFPVEDPHVMSIQLSRLLSDICQRAPDLRSASPKFAVRTVDGGERCLTSLATVDDDVAEDLRFVFQRVWDGMTRLPYTVAQITRAMATAAGLAVARRRERSDDKAAESFFLNPLAVDIARTDSRAYARAWGTSDAIRAAVRDDFETLLVPAKREQTFALPFNLLMTARNPRLLFDYDRLTKLFAQQLIPTQVALDRRRPTIFSPARVHVIGPA